MPEATNIHTEFHRFLGREDKECLLKQRGMVLWMYGLSGSGKSTIANETERVLHDEGRFTVILDGDNLRTRLNANLGFSDEDRLENIRRASEVAKLFAEQGVITFASFITPRRELRDLARATVGADFVEVFVRADYATCAERDPKGLYAKAHAGEVKDFTGKDSGFEEPENAELVLDTERYTVEECAEQLLAVIRHRMND